MARLIDYEQDDDKPFGIGKFKLDDGSEYYLDDPARAREFLSQYDTPSQRYGAVEAQVQGERASNFAADVARESNDIATQGEKPSLELDYKNAARGLAGEKPIQPYRGIDRKAIDPMRRAVAGPGGTEDESSLSSEPAPEENQSLAPNQSSADETPEEEDAAGAASRNPSEEELRNAQALERATNAAKIVARMPGTKGVDPNRLAREGVPVPKKVTNEGGLPTGLYEQQAADRVTAYKDTNDVLRQNQQNEQAQKLLEWEQLQGSLLAQKQNNDKQALELQRKQTQYEQDRQWLDHDVDAFYDKKPDGSRFFKNQSVFGTLATAIAQFMGAYASIVSGTPNFASRILDQQVERDVNDQIEEFKRGKMKRDGQLQRMAERGFSLEQMKAALRLQQEKVIEKESKAQALADGSRESMAAYQALMAQRQENFVKEENKFRTESLGKQTIESQVVQPQAPAALSPLEQLKRERDLLKLGNEVGYEARGGAPAERAEAREDKRAAAAGKQANVDTKRLTDYGNRRGVLEPAANEAQQAYDTLAALRAKHGHIPGVGQWDIGANEALQQFGTALGNEYMTDAGKAKQALKVIEGAAVRANKGSQTEGDVAREAEAMNGPNQSEEQVWSGVGRLTQRATTPLDDLNATYSDVVPTWQSRRDQTLLDKHKKKKEQDELRKKGEVY